ncbi:protein translocase subunit SecD [Streptomyces fradiae ATCC 10745 = DSM 40063]|nr:protein translocase subunit SecD [Streptomyces fradiae ATCC 10745 = DSM 40063]
MLIAMAALTGGMFWSGHTAPRLGIDLAGGTTITLKAKAEPGKESAVNETNMETAIGIIERRVNGLGVQEAEVQKQGTENIIVNIPKGTDEEQARQQVGTTAQLYFRPVMQIAVSEPATPPASGSPSAAPSAGASPKPSAPAADGGEGEKATAPSPSATTQGRALTDGLREAPSPGPSGAPSAAPSPSLPAPALSPSTDPTADAGLQGRFAALNCADPKQRASIKGAKPTEPTVACGMNGGVWEKYLLGAADVDGKDVDDAAGVLDPERGIWKVQLEFNDKGAKKFTEITGRLASQSPPMNQFAIVLDGEVVSAPSVSNAIPGGRAEITGSFDQKSAQDLGNMLSYGALPLTFEEQSVTTVTAALGGEQLRAGLIAGAIGLALVVLYLVVYYRGLSLIAILSLGVSAVLTYTIMSLLGPAIGFALNLPAVCGAIVAIGITADSFIVYFERIRDEIREGRTLRPAVERGWPRARRTILVSDFVSFLAAAVLFVVTVGKVQGFAFTLGLTTLLDVVVVFFFTKPLMTILARGRFYGGQHPWSGLDPKRLGAQPPLRRTRRVSVPTEPKEA